MPFAIASVGGLALAAAGVGAAASVYSANKAASAQTHAADSANALENSQYDQTRSDQAPYRTTGYSALSRMSDLLGLSGNTSADGYGSLNKPFTGSSVATDPGYQFGLNQGVKTAQDSAAARGGLYSGATLKALTQYGNDYATTKFDDAFNRDKTTKDTEYNRLAGVAGTGQTATNMVDTTGANVAANQGSNLIGAGNARGAADIATGNALTSGLNQAGAWWLRSQGNQTPAYNYSSSGGGVGTGAYVDQSSGTTYNNPSAYVGP
jgi:hypothetical protein